MYSSNNCSGCSFSYNPGNVSKCYQSTSSNSVGLENVVEAYASCSSNSNNFNFEDRIRLYDSREYQAIKLKDLPSMNTVGEENKYSTNHQNFNPLSFLNTARPRAQFITNVKDLLPLITDTFEKLTDEKFPDNVSIQVCSEQKLKEIHEKKGGIWSPTIQGFSLNKKGRGVNEIFVKEDALDSMMLTIGHEIGHVMTYPLNNAVDEEAKAFAFSLAWMKTIKENDIGGLAPNISPNPAKNGLHDKAFDFVINLLEEGKSAFQAFKEIVKGEFSSKQIIECEVY